MLPDQLSTAAAYLSLGALIRSMRRWSLFFPGSRKMTKALSRLSKFCGLAWIGSFGARWVTSEGLVSPKPDRRGWTDNSDRFLMKPLLCGTSRVSG
jgi:hypothetical protein